MTITYGITQTTYPFGDSVRISYGIAVYANIESTGTGTVILSKNDITSDRDRLLNLVLLCNHLKLSTIHLDDVIDDFLVN